jgi:hypothetical protein
MPQTTNLIPAGIGTLVVGAGLTALGLYLWSKERGTTQAGTGMQWTPG